MPMPSRFSGCLCEAISVRDRFEHVAEQYYKERLQTINGVSSVSIWGEKRYSVRLRMNPALLAAYGVTPMDVRDAVSRENVELPSGRIEGENTELTIRTLGRLMTIEDFNNLVIRETDSKVVRFRDIGVAEVDAEDVRSIMKRNGIPMVACVIIPQPGANYIDIVDRAYDVMQDLEKDLPADVEAGIAFDNTVFIRNSIDEVKSTIVEAFILVVLIIFLFLRNWRTTLIPVLAIPISLVGAFFIMYLAGFTINILTLLAVVLAIGWWSTMPLWSWKIFIRRSSRGCLREKPGLRDRKKYFLL